LVAIRSAAKIGRSTETTRGRSGEPLWIRGPNTQPSTTKISTGTPAPNTPNGSRTKILISSQVSLHSPRSMMSAASVANHVAGQFEKDVLECRELGAKVDHPDP